MYACMYEYIDNHWQSLTITDNHWQSCIAFWLKQSGIHVATCCGTPHRVNIHFPVHPVHIPHICGSKSRTCLKRLHTCDSWPATCSYVALGHRSLVRPACLRVQSTKIYNFCLVQSQFSVSITKTTLFLVVKSDVALHPFVASATILSTPKTVGGAPPVVGSHKSAVSPKHRAGYP